MRIKDWIKDKAPETIAALLQVEMNANPEWLVFALACVKQCAQVLPRFTSDDVVELMGSVPNAPTTHEARALGAVMLKAASQGWILRTRDFEPSSRVSTHNSPRFFWKSAIFAPQGSLQFEAGKGRW